MDTNWAFSLLDPTTICVILIVLVVSTLWILTANRGKTEPNFDVLYEKSAQATSGNKKSVKSRVKSKHLDDSPRPSKVKAVDEVSVSPSTVEDVTAKKENLPKKQAAAKTTTKKKDGKKKNQDDMRSTKKDTTHSTGNELSKENTDEGEWQTQLSRPQLRALRKKQRKSKEAGDTVNQSGTDGGSDSNGDVKQPEKEVGSRSASRGRRKNKGKEEGNGSPEVRVGSPANSTEDTTATTRISDTGLSGSSQQEVSSTDAEAPSENMKVEGMGSTTASAPVTCNSSIQDLEGALREAAFCNSSVNKLESPSPKAETEDVKPPQKRKRAKQKKKHEEEADSTKAAASNDERPPSVERESGDDWVVID